MTAAEVNSWHEILLVTAVVVITNALIGFFRPGDKNGRIAFVQACACTVFMMLDQITSGTPDGQAGIGIPIFLILFSVVAWAGLVIGGWLARRINQRL